MTAAIAEKLAEARKLIERGWCQNASARGKSGRPVGVFEPAATCFCAGGALRRVAMTSASELRMPLYAVIERTIETWNDAPERTQADVVEAFKRAEELAREQVTQ